MSEMNCSLVWAGWLRSLDDPRCLRACTHITITAAEDERMLAAWAEGMA